MPKTFQGLFEGAPSPTYDPDAWQKVRYHDLASWRGLKDWDRNSTLAEARIDFDPNTLMLTFSSSRPLPQVAAVNAIESDMLGNVAGSSRAAGPIAHPGAQANWRVDPRLPA
jgi:hypothetical protein